MAQKSDVQEWFKKPVGEQDVFIGLPVRVGKLSEPTTVRAIVEQLGGEENVAVTLADVHSLLEEHAQGKEVELFTDGSRHIFFVYNPDAVLCGLFAEWVTHGESGWMLYTNPADAQGDPCPAGCHVFRNAID